VVSVGRNFLLKESYISGVFSGDKSGTQQQGNTVANYMPDGQIPGIIILWLKISETIRKVTINEQS
jgi:hypothetical protein